MPTSTEQTARSGTQSAWDTITTDDNFNTSYERIVRGATTRAAREFPSNLGNTVRATPDSASYAGVTFDSGYYGTRTTTPRPGGAVGSGTFTEECCQATEAPDTEKTRLNEFRRRVRDSRDAERNSTYSSREYVRGLTNGELVNAAKAYEHLRPELWPFNGSRRFDAPECSEWNRMARAVAFLKMEQWRIEADYGTAGYEEAYMDLEQEIRRLEFKAIDLRWPRQREQDTEIDPF